MDIKTILRELNKGDVFTAKGTVVYSKKPQGAFHTQFLLIQDDSTGYSSSNQSLPIVVGVKEGEAYVNDQVLTVKGTVDVWQGSKKYKGRVLEVEKRDENLDWAEELFGGKVELESQEAKRTALAPVTLSKEESIARSVAVKAVAEMVAGKAIKIADFWTWTTDIENYLLNGIPELLKEEEEEEEEEPIVETYDYLEEKIPF